MAEGGININDAAHLFDIHKTSDFKTINRFRQTGLAGDHTRVSFISYKENFLNQTHFSEVSELSLVRKDPPKPSGTVSDARGRWSKY